MVKLKIDKAALAEPSVLLAQVAGLKSLGATPAENACLNLTPTTMSLTNMNEANAILVENIPIEVVEGDIGPHCDQGVMLNTRKLASIIKGSKKEVLLTINDQDSKVVIGSGRSIYAMEYYTVDKRPLADYRLFDYNITIKDVVKLLHYANNVTSNAVGQAHLSATLFDKQNAYCTDKITGLYLKNALLFNDVPPETQDILISTDLFASCLSKTTEESATMGITSDGRRIVMKLGNVVLYKSIVSEQFPKEKFVGAINSIRATKPEFLVSATVNAKQFIEKIKEHHGIIEAEQYTVTITANSLVISSSNAKIGTGGEVTIEAEEKPLPAEIGESISGIFEITPLLFIGEIFEGLETLEIRGAIGKQGETPVLTFIAIESENVFFFCVPKSA